MLGQGLNVFAPLAQRRDFDLEGNQAEIKIVAKRAFGHPPAEILMRGRNQAEVAVHGPLAADRQNLAVFQDAKQLCLHGHGYVGDFIEKDRAAVGLFEETFSRLLRAGERPPDVPEQFAFGQGRIQRGDVDGNKGRL